MIMFQSHIIIFSIIFGLVFTNPIEENLQNEKQNENASMEEPFQQAEMSLRRYFNLINSDTDHLVHAMLYLIINNPKSFAYVPRHALDVAIKNFEHKLGQDDVNTLIKPLLLTAEQTAENKSKQTTAFKLPEDVKNEIEDALDQFLEENADTNNL